MKRFVMFLAVSIFLIAINLGGGGLEYLSGYYPDGIYSFYCANATDLSGSISVGKGAIVSCGAQDYRAVRNSLSSVAGESFAIMQPDAAALDNIIAVLQVNMIRAETVEGTYIIYGYSGLLIRGVDLTGVPVNVQIAVTADRIIIGTPLILGSY